VSERIPEEIKAFYDGFGEIREADYWLIEPVDCDPRTDGFVKRNYSTARNGLADFAAQVRRIPWRIWVRPLGYWLAFVFALYFGMFCVVSIFRRQWVDRERLGFPLAQLPMEMVAGADRRFEIGPFFKTPLMWVGFIIPTFINTWNSLGRFYYFVRPIRKTAQLTVVEGLVTGKLDLNFPLLGFTYLIKLEVALSVWLFALATIVQGYWLHTLEFNLGTVPYTPFGMHLAPIHQAFGGLLVLVAFLLFVARRELWAVVKKAVGLGRGVDDSQEALPYAVAFWGFLASLVVLVVWLSAAGIALGISVLLVLLGFVIFLALTRMICEGGVPFVQSPLNPVQFVHSAMDPYKLTPSTIVGMPMTLIWCYDLRSFVMPMFANGLKIADAGQVRRRRLPWAIFLAVAVAVGVSFFVTIYIGYTHGGNEANTWFYESFPQRAEDRWQDPLPQVGSGIGLSTSRAETERVYRQGRRYQLLGGAVFMLVLMLVRHLFLWWPIHPIGFPFGATFAIQQFWMAVAIGWAVKLAVLRYGGVKLFKRLRPFFLGLILGEFLTDGVWFMIDLAIGQGFMLYN
jgi:hypothetical protein